MFSRFPINSQLNYWTDENNNNNNNNINNRIMKIIIINISSRNLINVIIIKEKISTCCYNFLLQILGVRLPIMRWAHRMMKESYSENLL